MGCFVFQLLGKELWAWQDCAPIRCVCCHCPDREQGQEEPDAEHQAKTELWRRCKQKEKAWLPSLWISPSMANTYLTISQAVHPRFPFLSSSKAEPADGELSPEEFSSSDRYWQRHGSLISNSSSSATLRPTGSTFLLPIVVGTHCTCIRNCWSMDRGRHAYRMVLRLSYCSTCNLFLCQNFEVSVCHQ